jgi:hypothetical protein
LGIPHYYYLDDNFVVLSEEIPELKEYTEENMRKELASFGGILASSKELMSFLAERNIHPKLHYFPPVMPSDIWLDQHGIPEKPADVTRIGFMGGPHRYEKFLEFVFPAITSLAENRKVELVIGGNHRIPDRGHRNIKIYHFPFDNSYRLALGRMQSADIDILVHPGTATRNNLYKTHNILLNALALEAFPILSNQPPYEDVEKLGLGLLCDDNPDEWHKNLLSAVSDSKMIEQTRKNLHQYVNDNYSGNQNVDVLKSISEECLTPGMAMIETRFRSYLDLQAKETYLAYGNPFWAKVMDFLFRIRFRLFPQNSLRERFARYIYDTFLSNQKK